jgi:N,N'-diacetyllegionaminate synthase
MEFTEEQWRGLKQHAEERGMQFLSSPFSVEAVDLLKRIGVRAWKIASGEVGNIPLLECIAETKLPLLISTGMSPLSEIDAAVGIARKYRLPTTILQCTSAYPCPPEKVGINLIPFLRKRYGCKVGLSDHSGTIYPGLAGATLGIDALEVHVTLSREMFGPDVPASITTNELRQLNEGIRFIERMNHHPIDKDTLFSEMKPVRELFTKSVVARCNLAAGTILTVQHLALKKPGTGIPSERLPELIGRTLRHFVKADQILQETDVA